MQAAVSKEGLRMFPSAIGHPRVVPPEGAVISGELIPGGVRFDLFSFHPNFLLDSPPLTSSLRSADDRWPEFRVCASITAHL
jgi:hypothetical protein